MEKAKAIKSEHKALGVVCFGYFRFRNARFGCAEVHQAIQCLGRAGMTRAREVAQAEGYRMVHALTDCVFLQKPGATREDAVRIARRITKEVQVPMDVEGVYRWLVLLPSKTHSTTSDVGVPNRYYGKFEDGTMKVRGIEVQRHITPPYLADVQQAMLDVFLEADDARGFLLRIPRALQVAKEAAGRIRRREVPPEELGLLVQATRTMDEYAVETGTKAALRHLEEMGLERQPGEYVKYVMTRTKGPRASRAMPVEMFGSVSPYGVRGGKDAYDVEAYLRLLARSVETLLSPFGYREEPVLAWLAGRAPRPLP
ncbi:MAG TPA: DNA polymerase domain-containing protein [Candidatus Thermoplasmatota archaeon]|nr:DNA polymerase domain-containing protein [Candidatus Thermoplasmatota archaeon]